MEIERQRKEEQADDRRVFSLPRGFQKQGDLAVLEGDRISVAPLGRPATPVEFRAGGLGKSAAGGLTDGIGRQGLRSAYFLMLVRPDGTALLEELQEQMTAGSISHGFDLIGRKQAILHPERGAAP
jgi:hypothetical protein